MVPNPFLSEAKNPAASSRWVDVLFGRITAAGAPSRRRLEAWVTNGATDVVTLQRADEMNPHLPNWCEGSGLGWHHLPLSGKRLWASSDLASLRRVGEVVELLRQREPPRSVVLHCSAGMHRTGICLYVALRTASIGAAEAFELIRRARPLTAEELIRPMRSGVLMDTAEALFLELQGPTGDSALDAMVGDGVD